MSKQVVWTKHCSDGSICKGSFMKTPPAFIPDEYEICDACLKGKYDMWAAARIDSDDYMGMGPDLYEEDFVINIIRRLDNDV